MSNKESLLYGAIKCLFRQGYARTTARDVAKEAGVSLAAIGYHYGTTEALLNQALIRATEIFSEGLGKNLPQDLKTTFNSRFQLVWERMYAQFDQNPQLWRVNVEVVAQAEYAEALHKTLVSSQPDARMGLAVLFHGQEILKDQKRAEEVGSVYQALLFGLLSQRLIDPNSSSSPKSIASALRYIGESFNEVR